MNIAIKTFKFLIDKEPCSPILSLSKYLREILHTPLNPEPRAQCRGFFVRQAVVSIQVEKNLKCLYDKDKGNDTEVKRAKRKKVWKYKQSLW